MTVHVSDEETVCITVHKSTYERLEGVLRDLGVESVTDFLTAVAEGSFGVYDMSESLDEDLAREQALQEEAFNYDQEVKRLCILHFFKEPRYVIDMSRYRGMIDMAPGLEIKVRAGLDKYLDERKILSDIYLRVRNHFQVGAYTAYLHGELTEFRNSLPPLPSLTDIDDRFQIEITDVYRRADSTVAKRIGQGMP